MPSLLRFSNTEDHRTTVRPSGASVYLHPYRFTFQTAGIDLLEQRTTSPTVETTTTALLQSLHPHPYELRRASSLHGQRDLIYFPHLRLELIH